MTKQKTSTSKPSIDKTKPIADFKGLTSILYCEKIAPIKTKTKPINIPLRVEPIKKPKTFVKISNKPLLITGSIIP